MLRQTRAAEQDIQQRMTEFEGTLESLREESEVMHVLLGLSSALMEVVTLEETLEKAVRIVKDTFGADRCFAASWDASSERFAISSGVGYEPEVAAVLAEHANGGGLGLLEQALKQEAPVLVSDVVGDGTLAPDEAARRDVSSFIAIPLKRRGEDFGALGVEFSRLRRFGSKDAALARGISRQVAVALTNARRFNLLQVLRSFGLRVGRSPLNRAAVARVVVGGAVELVNADAASVHFLNESQRTLVVGVQQGLPANIEERLARLDVSGPEWSDLVEGRVAAIPDVGSRLGLSDTRARSVAVAIPGSDGRVLGVIFLFLLRHPAVSFDEIEALMILSAQAATAIENAQRYERQRHVAVSLQRGLLATEMPAIEGSDVGTVYEPASEDSEVGGDFYDVFDLPDGRVGLVVGDVSGKGAEAAAQMAMAKYMLRAFATRNPSPTSVLFHLNNALAKGLGEDRFATLVYGVFDPDTHSVLFALAGHPPPLVYRTETVSVESIHVDGGALGLFEGQSFDHTEVSLGMDDVLLLYTDGITETRNDGELYGMDRLKASLARTARLGSAQQIAEGIYQDARAFGEVGDDAVVLTFRCLSR